MKTLTKVKERPILFNGEMVRAILEGRKTMTRRPVKPQPIIVKERFDFDPGEYTKAICVNGGWHFQTETKWPFPNAAGRGVTTERPCVCPYGQPGDRLYVRETWRVFGGREYEYQQHQPSVRYRADADTVDYLQAEWRPSIHMPRWASRILLEIVSVRVERIRDISDRDIKAEGYMGDFCNSRFSDSWNATYPGSWDRNEWVWVIEFKRIEQQQGEAG